MSASRALNCISKADHFMIKDDPQHPVSELNPVVKETLKKLQERSQLDRNIKLILDETMMATCIYSDCSECSLKDARSIEQVISHQRDCRACLKCKYLCPDKDCFCNQYLNHGELQQHLRENKQRGEPVKKNDKVKVYDEEQDPKADDHVVNI